MHLQHLTLWSIVMLVACIVSTLRLVTFRRGTSRHRGAYAWLSWLYIVGLTLVTGKLAFGIQPPPGAIEAIASVAIAVLLAVHRGNVAHVHRAVGRALRALTLRFTR